MTDAELIAAIATRVFGWLVVPFDWEDRHDDTFPRLIENINRDWVLCLAKDGDWDEFTPLTSDADAFMVVDAMRASGYGFSLHSFAEAGRAAAVFACPYGPCERHGNTALDRGHGSGDVYGPDRRRAIVLAALVATGDQS